MSNKVIQFFTFLTEEKQSKAVLTLTAKQDLSIGAIKLKSKSFKNSKLPSEFPIKLQKNQKISFPLLFTPDCESYEIRDTLEILSLEPDGKKYEIEILANAYHIFAGESAQLKLSQSKDKCLIIKGLQTKTEINFQKSGGGERKFELKEGTNSLDLTLFPPGEYKVRIASYKKGGQYKLRIVE